MAEVCEAAASSSSLRPPSPSTLTSKEKPVVVRVKRKASQTRPAALWLEISERPQKRALLNLDKLSFSDRLHKEKDKEEKSTPRKIFVQHVETISSSEAMKDLLGSCLANSGDLREFNRRIEERKHIFKEDKKQEQLRATARQQHEVLARSARFEQIWKNRRGNREREDDFIQEMCHLYDVIRVDDEEDHQKMEEDEEYLPTAAEEIESDMMTAALSQDGYVYDIYAMENVPSANAEATAQYPLVQVNDDDDSYFDQLASDYETDDSNAENNPLNDYPDEETSEDEGQDGLLSDDTEEYEREMVYTSEEEAEDCRWSHR